MKKKMYVLILTVLLAASLLCACASSDAEETTIPDIMLSTEPAETAAPTTEPTEETQPTETTAPEETTEPSTEPTAAETEPAETTAQHSHSYTSTVVAPTCTTDGYTLHKCKTCTYSYKSNQTAALGHSYKDKVVAPTTSAEGYTLHTCKTCGYSYKDNYKNKLDSNTGNTNTGSNNNHTHSYSSSVTAPTCTEKGYTTYTCKTCNYSYKGNYTDKAAHKLEYSFTDPAGCDKTDVGYDCYACTVCGYCEHRNTVPSTGMHEWGQWTRTKEPTTSETGVETRVCALCKTTETRTVDKLPAEPHTHSYTSKVTASTCTEEGYTTYTCNTCNYSYKGNYTDKAAHKLEYNFTDPAGCGAIDVGYDCYKCAYCVYCQHRNFVPATGNHTWGEWAVTTPATTTSEGVETRTCTYCGQPETRKIDRLPAGTHTCSYTSTVVTAPTCTENGYTTHACSCGASYTENETNATGHTWGEWTRTKEPTASETGVDTRTCSVCRTSETRSVDKLPAETHTHSYTSSVTAPTCTANGYTTYTCSCGGSYTENATNATGHTWGEWTRTKEPTTSETGVDTRTCSVCRASETRSVDKLPGETHNTHSYTPTVTAPTCTEMGYTMYICACGDSYKGEEVSWTGHSWGEWIRTKEPTTSETGEDTRTCGSCNTSETRTVNTKPSIDTSGSYGVTEVLDIINGYRTDEGLSALSYNSGAQECANIRAAEIGVSFGHTRPDGTHYSSLADSYGLWGECIAGNYSSAQSVVDAWMNSDNHRGSLMADWFTCAVVARNGNNWVILFG